MTNPTPSPIIVVGSHGPGYFLNVAHVPVAGENVLGWGLRAPPDGGKGSNQAVAAARLGAPVSFVGCVGADALGDESLGWLAAAGVDLTHVTRTAAAPTLGGLVLLDDAGQPAIITLRDAAFAHLTVRDVDRALAQSPAAGVLITQFEIPVAVALHAARQGQARGLYTIVNPSPAPSGPLDLSAADLLLPNETEALTLLGRAPAETLPPEALARQVWRATGAGCVLVTLGDRGAAYAGLDGEWQLAPPPVTVVDATGAGDAFCGALAAQLARGFSLHAAARYATLVAAYTVTQPGTLMAFPNETQVIAFAAACGWALDVA